MPVEFDTDVLYHKEILSLLLTTGVWKKDAAGSKFLTERAFTVQYPIRIIDSGGKANLLLEGWHYTVCL